MDAQAAVTRRVLQAITTQPARALVAVDFDGTLSPITSNPDRAVASPAAITALGRVGELVGTVVIVTGRAPRKVLELADMGDIAGLAGLVILGQYGAERWDGATGKFFEPPIPLGIEPITQMLPGFLRSHRVEAELEYKGRAIGVHLRNHPDPSGAIEQIHQPLIELAARYGLVVQPGRLILEVCAAGHNKGQALRSIIAERRADSVIFAGDDLGDISAFEAIDELRADGFPGLKVCAASPEQQALVPLADVVVDAVPGVARWLNQLADGIEQAQSKAMTNLPGA